jgi:hypothetical protein
MCCSKFVSRFLNFSKCKGGESSWGKNVSAQRCLGEVMHDRANLDDGL